MWLLNLRTRFFVVLSGLGLLILSVCALSLYLLGRQQVLRDQAAAKMDTLNQVARVCREAAVESNYITAINYLKLLREDRRIVHAGCLDLEERFRAHTIPGVIGETFAVNRGRPVGSDEATTRVARVLDKTYVEMTLPVMVRGKPAGTTLVQYDEGYLRADIRRRLLDLIWNIALPSIALMLSVVLGVSLLLARTLAAPIAALEEAAVEFGKGRFDYRPAVAERRDEVGRLCRSLTAMAERLGELDRLKQRFLEHITHDLRAPLTAIHGYAEMISEGLSGPVTPKQVQQLQVVKENSLRLAQYIDDILDLAKMEAGGISAEKKPVSLEDVMNSVEQLLRVSALEYGVRLEMRCEPGLPTVFADAELLRRAVTNLIGNALKFTPKEGLITVAARREGAAAVLISVHDTGPGIPKEKLEKVFDKFFQVTETKGVARKVGTGLGLTITREIVQAHGGRIWVESDPGRGATFSFTLPTGGATGQNQRLGATHL